MSSEVYNKLAFNGYRAFICEPPDYTRVLPNMKGMLSYRDYNWEDAQKVAELLGHFPSPKDIAEHLAHYNNQQWRTNHFLAAFTIDGSYQKLWTADWYAALKIGDFSWSTPTGLVRTK